MGFRYVGVTGIDPADLDLSAIVLHSDIPQTGTFTCSDPLINRLNENIQWSGRSNFVDIPTDCPQRDERQGWTGDLAVFASTATYNFDMSRFLDKWLRDVAAEQGRGGGIPMVVPRAGDHWPVFATSCWGDSCILVPWAEYLARGDLRLLRRQYPTMKRFLRAAKWWAALGSVRPSRQVIWSLPYHWGDWAAPVGGARQWVRRGKWIATAYFANSCTLMARIADLLEESSDATYYRALRVRIVKAYREVFTDGGGKLKNEFQTAYVLPLYFGMTVGEESTAMVANLVRLIDDAGGHLGTGFPGTPYILFALSDHGRVSEAYELLRQTSCPSWLYTVAAGGTTIWERWDGLRPDGSVNIASLSGKGDDESSSGGMVSFNHYAAGAVGDWLYRRIAGIEAVEGGYRSFRVAPIVGGGLTSAQGRVVTPFGRVASDWTAEDGVFTLRVSVPVSTSCTVVLPDGSEHVRTSGQHEFTCLLPAAG
jgi:alpha-L-rhamnosidase